MDDPRHVAEAATVEHTGCRKIDAMRYLGLLERDGENVKLSDAGRAYADGSEQERANVMGDPLRAIPLSNETIQWLHYTVKKADAPPRTTSVITGTTSCLRRPGSNRGRRGISLDFAAIDANTRDAWQTRSGPIKTLPGCMRRARDG